MPPLLPIDVPSLTETEKNIILSWHAAIPMNNTGKIKGITYAIEVRSVERLDKWCLLVDQIKGNQHTIEDTFDPKTDYQFRIFAANVSGKSCPTEPVTLRRLLGNIKSDYSYKIRQSNIKFEYLVSCISLIGYLSFVTYWQHHLPCVQHLRPLVLLVY